MPINTSTKPLAFLGMDRSSGVDNLPAGMMRYAQNVRFTLDGSWKVRKGYIVKSELPEENGYAIVGLDLQDYQALFVHMGTKIFVSQDTENYYDIGATRSAVNSKMFTNGQNVYHINREDEPLQIATSRVTVDVVGTVTEITIDPGDLDNFSNAGTVYIQGSAISYTGINSTNSQLTGVTGVPATADYKAGTIITQVNVRAGMPKGSAIAEFEGSTIIGGRPDHPEIFSYSVAATEQDPQFEYDFFSAQAGSKKMRDEVTALYNSKGALLIGMRNSLAYSGGFGGPSGDVLITDIMHNSDGANNDCSIADIDGVTGILSRHRLMFATLSQSGGVQLLDSELEPTKNIDYMISRDLKLTGFDQSLSFLHYADKERELIASVWIKGVQYNYVRSFDSQTWSVDTGKPFTQMCEFKNGTYAVSSFTNKVYQDYVGKNDEGAPIHSIVRTGEMNANRGLSTSDYSHIIFGGNVSHAGAFRFKVFIDGEEYINEYITVDSLKEQRLTLDPVVQSSVGPYIVGPSPLGFDAKETKPTRFMFPYELLLVGENIILEWEVLDTDTDLEIRKFSITSETEAELEISNFS